MTSIFRHRYTGPGPDDYIVLQRYSNGRERPVDRDQSVYLDWIAAGNTPAEIPYKPPPPPPAPTWDDYRAQRAMAFSHWNSYVPGMLALEYPPAVAIKADIEAGYTEVLDLPDSESTPAEAIARLQELDAWLSQAVGRSPAF